MIHFFGLIVAAVYDDWHGTGAMCYESAPGTQLVVNIGIALTSRANLLWPQLGDAPPHQLLTAVRAVNDVFEGQVALRFNVSNIHYAVENYDNPACTDTIGVTLSKFRAWATTQQAPVAIWHLIDGCYTNGCAQCASGITSSFQICPEPATAVTHITGSSTWSTLAHELGHNFGANHPFADNDLVDPGDTGGLMDYYNPTYDGASQFNTIESKTTICAGVRHLINHCNNTVFAREAASTSVATPTVIVEYKSSRYGMVILMGMFVAVLWIAGLCVLFMRTSSHVLVARSNYGIVM